MRRLPSCFYNATTLAGTMLAGTMLACIGFLFILDLTAPGPGHPYLGLVTWIVLPGFLILGVITAIVGIVKANLRAKAAAAEPPLPRLDLNLPGHRRAAVLFTFGTLAFVALSAFGSYQAYEYTDSVEFCGKLCHSVMKPEYVAYQASPHARVTCVACHIGEGATWYVRSKLSGAYQVYSTLFNKYHRPIPTPLENLRPAKETCEQCHWPKHFYSQKLEGRTYFLSDEKNSRAQINMLMKIGGGSAEHGATEGIHAHMYLDHEITYVATDRQRLVIPYVESKSKDGKVTRWRSKEHPLTESQLRTAKRHVVDCIDCHNRPTHIYRHPARSVNLAMSLGQIDPSLPEIRRLGVELLEKPWKTEKEAVAGIRSGVDEFYAKNHPAVARSARPKIEAAIQHLQAIYSRSYFPEMKVSWRSYPDRNDHMYSEGCFRCHDNQHVADDGRVLTNDCNLCHTIVLQRGPDGKTRSSVNGMQFVHPVEIGDAWKSMQCSTPGCHVAEEAQQASAARIGRLADARRAALGPR